MFCYIQTFTKQNITKNVEDYNKKNNINYIVNCFFANTFILYRCNLHIPFNNYITAAIIYKNAESSHKNPEKEKQLNFFIKRFPLFP